MAGRVPWWLPSCLGCLGGCLGGPGPEVEVELPEEAYVTIVTAEGRPAVVCLAGEEVKA